MKKLLIALGLGGLAVGGLMFFKGNRRKRLIRKLTRLILEEGTRLNRLVHPRNIELSLQRLSDEQLELLYTWTDAYIHRDMDALELMAPRVVKELGPLVESSPDWTLLRPIIFEYQQIQNEE